MLTHAFDIRPGTNNETESGYLPFGTTTLRIKVTNQTGEPLKLWLRPERTPPTYPERHLHGFGDDDDDLWIHWAGGEETGAAVKTEEKKPLRDRTVKVWEVIPMAVAPGESQPVFINVTHVGGEVRERRLTLRPITERNGRLEALNGTLRIRLTVPERTNAVLVTDPVRGRWDSAGQTLTFAGTQLPDYVSRWWPHRLPVFREAESLPERLALMRRSERIWLTLDGKTLATIVDHDWKPGHDIPTAPVVQPELFHFCDGRYYVARIWFLWLDKKVGVQHEVPDAERVDVLFDSTWGPEPVAAVGTDFHYQETWGRLQPGEQEARIALGLGVGSLSTFALTSLTNFLRKARVDDPARVVAEQLCGSVTWQKGPRAHVPLLTNVDVFAHMTSHDVRDA